jgi:hypothetical protein
MKESKDYGHAVVTAVGPNRSVSDGFHHRVFLKLTQKSVFLVDKQRIFYLQKHKYIYSYCTIS